MPDVHKDGEAERVDAVLDGDLPDVVPANSDGETTGPAVSTPPSKPIRSGFRRRPREDSPERRAAGESRTRRRGPLSAVFRLLRRLWIPLVIIAVLAAGGVAVSRLHGIFGSETRPSYDSANPSSGAERATSSQLMRYEVFGPAGTVALISYFDGEGNVKSARGVSLPWSLEFPVTTAASVGSVAAQGDSDSIGCRITIDGVVKAEKITEQVSAFASCILKAS